MDSLNPSWRWGFRSNFRQIRPIVDGDRPDRCAIEVRDQWVASFGVSSRVAVTTSLDPVQQDRRRPARPRFVDQPVQPPLDEPAPPLRHRLLPDPQAAPPPAMFDEPSAQAKNDLGPQRQRLRRRSTAAPTAATDPARPRSTTSSAFGRPGRGRSTSPSSRDSANRRRTLCTVITLTPSSIGQPRVHHARLRAGQHDPRPDRRPRPLSRATQATEPARHRSTQTRPPSPTATYRHYRNYRRSLRARHNSGSLTKSVYV